MPDYSSWARNRRVRKCRYSNACLNRWLEDCPDYIHKGYRKGEYVFGLEYIFLLNIPALLVFIAPVLLWFKSRLINILLAIYYGMSSFILIL